jgi:hypothetical protein
MHADPDSFQPRPVRDVQVPREPRLRERVRGVALVLGTPIVVDLGVLASIAALLRWVSGRPPRRRLTRRTALLGAALPLIYAMLRPAILRWGASDREVNAPMLGDELVPNLGTVSTRAVTVDAPAERVWPWVAQLGYDTAGFYRYSWLDDLAGEDGADAASSEERPNHWQRPRTEGDPPPMPPHGSDPAVAYVPGQALALHNWGTFAVEPLDERRSRLVVRTRGRRGLAGAFFNPLLGELPHFVMEHRLLRRIKQRAEHEMASAASAPAAGAGPTDG